MGRTEPSVGRPPASFRRDARAKRAKATVNKVIPAVLAAHPRARRGIEASELIVDPLTSSPPSAPAPAPAPVLRSEIQQRSRRKNVAAYDDADGGGGGSRNDNNNENSAAGESSSTRGPRISLRVADTLAAAYLLLLVPASEQARRDLSNTTARVGVLNMASPLSPGGGFLNGAVSQEESLCMHSTLLPSLRDSFYRLPELGVVFTPDVLVFRGPGGGSTAKRKDRGKKRVESERGERAGKGDDINGAGEGGNQEPKEPRGGDEELLPKRDRWFVDVASAAMLRLPEIEVDAESGWARYSRAADRELVMRKMRAVLRVFAAKGVRRIVLGAWGCGAYGNPVGEIARAWRKVLLGRARDGNKIDCRRSEGKGNDQGKKRKATKDKIPYLDSWGGFEHVVFAIKDAGMARAFATAFGEDALEGYGDDEEEIDLSGDEEGDDGDIEDEKVKELRDKIREMELRAEQARTPQLKAGLSSVLAGLRNQLPQSINASRTTLSENISNRDDTTEDEVGDESTREE